jgi:hypothetical protein
MTDEQHADEALKARQLLATTGWSPDKAHYGELFTLGMMRGAEVLAGIFVAMIVDGRPSIIGEETARTNANDLTTTALRRFTSVLPEDVMLMAEKLRQTLVYIEVMQRGTGDDGTANSRPEESNDTNVS